MPALLLGIRDRKMNRIRSRGAWLECLGGQPNTWTHQAAGRDLSQSTKSCHLAPQNVALKKWGPRCIGTSFPEVRNPEVNVASTGLQTLAADSLTSLCWGIERGLGDTSAPGGRCLAMESGREDLQLLLQWTFTPMLFWIQLFKIVVENPPKMCIFLSC